ncbi:MAG: MFS transporter, partial [Anaerolineaceae bacterium]|nr:MFS transporter [Anaerolineaceae bacterium]
AWYMYDFGNSSYAAIVLLAVYSAYFKNAVVGGAEGTRLWGWSVGIAAVLVALISPILGSIADFSRSKKRLLFIFTTLSVIFTAMLFFVRAGDVITGMVFFILAEIGYRGAQVFYDALLVDISTPQTIGYISGKGWAVGMVGGVISLLFVLVPIQLIGNAFIPFAFLIAAFFYLLSSLPIYLKVRELTEPEIIPAGESVFSVALKKLGTTFRDVRNYKEFIKYMAAFLIYNDGIMMLMDFAAIIGATLFGMEQVQLILFVIVIQITGALGALLFGKISDKQSSKQAITISLVVLMISLVGIFFITSMTMFFVIGAFAGFALSGAQAVSRTMVSQLAPAGKTTEFYGFLSVAGRTSTFVGPLVFSTVSYRMHNFYINHGMAELAAEQAGLFWAVGAIILFLIVGFFILLSVRKVTAQEPMIYS